MMVQKRKGLVHFFRAFKYSWEGVRSVVRGEAAFRQELILCAIGAIVLALVDVSVLVRVILGVSLVFILIAELINTAIENIVDRIGPEHHELSKNAKDIGSAIVCLTITTVVCMWFFILCF